jgi:hypothetical protein
MNITHEIVDPNPDAERGTLEYALSAAGCRSVVRIEMTFPEAYKLIATDPIYTENLRARLRAFLDQCCPS